MFIDNLFAKGQGRIYGVRPSPPPITNFSQRIWTFGKIRKKFDFVFSRTFLKFLKIILLILYNTRIYYLKTKNLPKISWLYAVIGLRRDDSCWRRLVLNVHRTTRFDKDEQWSPLLYFPFKYTIFGVYLNHIHSCTMCHVESRFGLNNILNDYRKTFDFHA